MNGVDVSGLKVGDVLELSEERANMMIELGWAEYASANPPDALDGQDSPDIRTN